MYVNRNGECLEKVGDYVEIQEEQLIVEQYLCYCYSSRGDLLGKEVFDGYLNKSQMRWMLGKYAENEDGAFLKMEKRYVLADE